MKSNPPKKWVITSIIIFFMLLCLTLIAIIYTEWPPSKKGLLKGFSDEQQLILLVALCGALGSFIHMATSFTDYLGSQLFEKSWIPWYLMRPFIGATLALAFYFLIRGGLVTVNAPEAPGQYSATPQDTLVHVFYDTAKGVSIRSSADSLAGMKIIGTEKNPVRKDGLPINPFGIAAISLLAGLFSRQAVDKLRELFENIFLTKEKVNRANPLPTESNTGNNNSKDDQPVG